MSIGWAGSSNTANGTTGYRLKAQNDLLTYHPRYLFTFSNISFNGYATFPNLVNLADLSSTELVIFDQSNDGDDDMPEFEAFIRKCAEAGQRVIAIINPSWTAITDDQINSPYNETVMGLQIAVCEAYGVPYVDGWQICKDHVTGGGHLNEMFADTAHWAAAGYTAVEAALDDYLPTGGAISMPLPARIHADTDDFEQTPTIKNGTDDDSRTGAWTDDGTGTSSNSVGATITYSFTGRKFGIWNSNANYPLCKCTIDGGAPISNFQAYPNGYDVGSRGAHTVVFEVTTGTFEVDEFWAI